MINPVGFSGKSRPNSAPARVQNRNQMGHGQFVNNYARNAQSGVPGKYIELLKQCL